MDYELKDSRSLYFACCSHERSEQSAAYQALGAYLYAIAYQMVDDLPDSYGVAQDCSQEALLRIHKNLVQCNPAAFLGWSRKILQNLVIDKLRQRNKLQLQTLPDDLDDDTPNPTQPGSTNPALQTPSPDNQVLIGVAHEQLRRLIDQAPLSAHARRLVVGFYFEGYTHEELAKQESEHTGRLISPENTMVTLSKAVTKLKQFTPLIDHLKQR